MIHSKSLKRALAFLMVIVIMFVTIFTDNVVKRVLVRAGDNVEAGSGSDGEDANPSANPSAAPSAAPDEDETIIKDCTLLKTTATDVNYIGENGKTVEFTLSDSVTNVSKVEWGYVTNGVCDTLNEITVDSDNKYKFDLTTENMTENDNYAIRIVVTDTDNKVKYIDYTIVLSKTKNEIQNCNLDKEANRTIGVNGKTVEFTVNNTDTVAVERVEWCYVTDGTCGEFYEISVDKDDANKYKFAIVPGEDMTGEVTVKVKITNVLGNVDEKDYTLTVDRSVLTIENCSLKEDITNVLGKNPTSVSFNVINGKGNVEWGYVTDNVYNKKAELDETDGKYEFEINPSEIADGKVHTVRIITTNELGNSAKKEYAVIVDYEAPEIGDIDSNDLYIDKDGKDITVSVTDDKYEIKSVTWNYEYGNNTQNAATSNNDGTFTFNLKPEEGMTDGQYKICVTATNELGNSAKKEYAVIVDNEVPEIKNLNGLFENEINYIKTIETPYSISFSTDNNDCIAYAEWGYITKDDNNQDKYEKEATCLSDGSNYSFAIEKSDDGKNEVYIKIVNKCKKEKTFRYSICIDNTPPEISEIKYENAEALYNGKWINFNNNSEIGIVTNITDTNINTDFISIFEVKNDYIYSDYETLNKDAKRVSPYTYELNKGKLSIKAENLSNGENKLIVYAKDKAGNESTCEMLIYKDTEIPKGKITIDNWSWEAINNIITFGKFKNNTCKFKILNTSEDIEKKSYYMTNKIADVIIKSEDIQNIENWTEYQESEGIDIAIPSATVVYAKLVDKAGNEAYICSDGVVIDNSNIDFDINWTNNDWTNNVEDISIKMNGYLSGVASIEVSRSDKKSIEWSIDDDNKVIKNGKWTINDDEKAITDDSDKESNIEINKNELSEGDYSINIKATNRVGTEGENSINIKYDKTAPKIVENKDNIKSDNWINIENQKKEKIEFEISDTKAEINTSGIKMVKLYTVKSDEISDDLLKKFYDNKQQFSSNDNVKLLNNNYNIIYDNNSNKSCKVKIEPQNLDEGKYFVVVVAEDNAGNVNVYRRFIKKDITKPEARIIAVDMDNMEWNKFQEKITFKNFCIGQQTYKFTSCDNNAVAEASYCCTKSIESKKDEESIKDEKIKWSKLDIKENTGMYNIYNYVTIAPDDKKAYSTVVYMKVSDEAGNVSYICSDGIQIDGSEAAEPNIEINPKEIKDWIKNGENDYKITITITSSSGLRSYSITGMDDNECKWESENPEVNNGEDKKFKKTVGISDECDIKIVEGKNDITIKATGKNNRSSEQTITVNYDKHKPKIKFEEVSGLKNGWINKDVVKSVKTLNFTVNDRCSGIDRIEAYVVSDAKDIDAILSNNGTQLPSSIKNNKNYLKFANNYSGEEDVSVSEQISLKDDIPEGKSILVVYVKDMAKNEVIDTKEILKDTKLPKINDKSTLPSSNTWINNDYDTDSSKKPYIKVSAKDTISDTDISDKYSTKVSMYRYYSDSYKESDFKECLRNNNKVQKLSKKRYEDNYYGLDKLPDGIYYVVIVAEDNAGNKCYKPIKVQKDTKSCEIDIKRKQFANSIEDSFNTYSTAKWINSSNINNLKLSVKSSDKDYKDTTNNMSVTSSGLAKIYAYKSDTNDKKVIKESKINKDNKLDITYVTDSDKSQTISIDMSQANMTEGEYWINVVAVDKAGNSNINNIKIHKDITIPESSIIFDNNKWDRDSVVSYHDLSFSIFNNKPEKVFRLQGSDSVSGISKAYYYYTQKASEAFGIKTVDSINDSNWTEIDLNNKGNKIEQFDSDIRVDNDYKNLDVVMYMKLIDNAGNITYFRSNGVTFDVIDPQEVSYNSVVTISGANADDIINTSDVSVNYTIKDPKADGTNTNSGIKIVKYKIETQDSGNMDDYDIIYDFGDSEAYKEKYIQKDDLRNEYDGTIRIDSARFNSNNVTVTIAAEDNSGNNYSAEHVLKIDTTKPTVNVTYKDSTGAEVEPNGRYFNNDVTMVVTVTERNFDADATLFRINGQQVSLNGMTHVGDSSAGGNGDGDTHTYEYRFTGDEANDKDYTVEYVSCTDKAGNVSDSTVIPQTFTVDKVQPTVSANDAAGYSSSALTYTATVVERNFDEAGAKVLVTKRLNGSLSYENREYPVIWSTSGDTHTAALSFAEDGDYSFTITCTDKAGNQQAAVYTSKEFTVDNVDPVLTSNISEENNNIANKGNIDFEYVYTDINSSNESGMIGYKVRTLAGTAVNDWVPEIKNVNVDGVNGYTIKFHDNATATKLKDGIYTIELTVKDKAGREAKDEKQFSVNRHGSAYSYISSSYTGAVILQQYVKEITDDIEVVVMNCDDITQYQVEVWNSLNEQNILKPDEDYTWKKENSGYVYKEDNSNRESGFTMYSCKIKPEVFSNEGTYTVRVSTKDIADDAAYGDNAALLYNDDTNTDNNMDITTNMDTAQADKIEFTVDRTNPEIVIMDIDNNGKYNLDKKFSFDYADANELDDIKIVRKDGDKVLETITYKPSDLKDLKTGNISAVAKEYDGYQTITVSATDKAGNMGSASVKVLVTSNIWVKYINNTPLVVATIIVAVVAAGGIVFIFYRRRKRGEQSQS